MKARVYFTDGSIPRVFDDVDVEAMKEAFNKASEVIMPPKFVVAGNLVLAIDEVQSVAFYDEESDKGQF